MLDIALECARRGWYVFPCRPRSKKPMTHNGFKDATISEEQIRIWWNSSPEANVAIATGPSGLCVVDLDEGVSQSDVNRWMMDHGLLDTYAVRTGRRSSFGLQLYYAGNGLKSTGWSLPDGSKGDIRCATGYVMAAGSLHDKSHEAYTVLHGVSVVPVPDSVRSLTSAAKETSIAVTVDGATADGWKTWLLDYMDRNRLDPRDYEKRVSNGYWLGIHCPWESDHGSGAGSESSTVLGILDGKIAFECSHGTCKAAKRNTDIFKQLMTLLHNEAAPEPGADVGVILSGKSNVQPEAAHTPERVRPVYPIAAWDGTVVSEFVKLSSEDNNIPLKMYAESFRCVLGAVVGDRISCPGVDGALPRTYTVIVAPKGKGKGTAIRRAVRFFTQDWSGGVLPVSTGLNVSVTGGLLSGERDFLWKPRGIGAYMAAASSVPGMSRLCRDLDSTTKNKPHMTWGNTLPRVLSVHEEMKTFLSTLFIEGGVGSGMEGVVCQLWDDVTFHGTATGTRDAAYGEMMFSMLCGVTEEDWFDLLSRGNAVGSGLMSRFNIIGTEGGFENVSRMHPPDFRALQETFLPRVMQLEDAHARIVPSAAAEGIICEWADNLPEGSERMNVHAWRSALLIAWLRHETVISAKTAQDAVSLGQYQIASHEYYRTTTADNPVARIQERISRALKTKGSMKKRDLQKVMHAERDGTELWNRALDGLVRDGRVGKSEDGSLYLAA